MISGGCDRTPLQQLCVGARCIVACHLSVIASFLDACGWSVLLLSRQSSRPDYGAACICHACIIAAHAQCTASRTQVLLLHNDVCLLSKASCQSALMISGGCDMMPLQQQPAHACFCNTACGASRRYQALCPGSVHGSLDCTGGLHS